jgi:dUTP pyrophosphatase
MEDTKFVCRICGCSDFKEIETCGKISKTYTCSGCGVVFADIQKFNLPQIKFFRYVEDAKIPTEAHGHNDTGYDLYTIDEKLIYPGEVKLFKTGIKIEYPKYFGSQIRCRSGLGKKGIQISNGPGTIDSCYRGDHGILLYNSTKNIYTVNKYDRIAQLVIEKTLPYELIEVDSVDETIRGSGGYGHTGQ